MEELDELGKEIRIAVVRHDDDVYRWPVIIVSIITKLKTIKETLRTLFIRVRPVCMVGPLRDDRTR
jgi:hypothetical protein